jgi:hypothetical protein
MRISILAAVLALAPLAAQATTFGPNLIVNGNAEAGAGSSNGGLVGVPGWVTSSNFTAVQYGASGGFPSLADAGPAARGNNFFAGGDSNAFSSATQSISLASLSAGINTGNAQFDLSGWLGGYASQDDHTVLTVTFRDGSNNVLSSASLTTVTGADRGNQTALLLRDTQGYIPVGALSADIALNMTRNAGGYNDGYADNLSFAVAAPVPEPETYAMLVSGMLLLGVAARRKQNQG